MNPMKTNCDSGTLVLAGLVLFFGVLWFLVPSYYPSIPAMQTNSQILLFSAFAVLCKHNGTSDPIDPTTIASIHQRLDAVEKAQK